MKLTTKHLLILAAVAFSCTADKQVPSVPSAVPTSLADADGSVHGSADGDVKVGTGALVIDDVRMDRQTATGASVVRQYANPGRVYRMELGETIELWVEWDRNIGKVPAGSLPSNPRLIVNWGAGEEDSPDNTNCGGCLLRHTYKRKGVYTVTVRLDDRVGTTVTRTFILDSTDPVSAPSPSPTPSPSPSPSPTPCCTFRGDGLAQGICCD